MRSTLLLVYVVAAAACGRLDAVAPVEKPNPPEQPAPDPGGVSLSLARSEFVLWAATELVITPKVRRAGSSAAGALVHISDESVLVMGARHLQTAGPANGRWEQIVLQLVGRREGRARVTVTLGDSSEHVDITVGGLAAPPPKSVVVESFGVVEFRSPCVSCNSLLYAPALRLRDTGGTQGARLAAVRYVVAGLDFGWCQAGTADVIPGTGLDINVMDPYLYNNDMLHGSANGVPLPEAENSATILIREPDGEIAMLRVDAPTSRLGTTPSSPLVYGTPKIGWYCVSHGA